MANLPKEVLELFNSVVSDRSEMNKVLHFCSMELRKVDRFFDWKPIFQNMINLGIIDEDEGSKEFRTGLCEFYEKMLTEVREVESSDLSFLGDCEGELNRTLFHDNMIIGVCLLNDVKCYSEEEMKIVKLMGGCMLRKFKHDHTLERLTKLGDTSHLFDDPIDISQRE